MSKLGFCTGRTGPTGAPTIWTSTSHARNASGVIIETIAVMHVSGATTAHAQQWKRDGWLYNSKESGQDGSQYPDGKWTRTVVEHTQKEAPTR